MAGGMCLSSSQRNTPISDHQFPYHNPVHSPVMTRNSFINMKSPIITKQRPKTDILNDAIQTLSGRPKTAKLHPLRHLSQGSRGAEVTSKVNSNPRVGDYLSQKCNNFDMSDLNSGFEAQPLLRDDEEYYLNMDPVEYFYSPIIDIFPIATITAKMKSNSQQVLDESLQSSTHFLPIIEPSSRIREANHPKLSPLPWHKHSKILYHESPDGSRKSSLQDLIAPKIPPHLHVRKAGLFIESKECSQKTRDRVKSLSSKEVAPIENGQNDQNELSGDCLLNKQNVESNKANLIKPKTRIPIAQSYFLHENKTEGKLTQLKVRNPITLRASVRKQNISNIPGNASPSPRHVQQRKVLKPISKQGECHIQEHCFHPNDEAKKTHFYTENMRIQGSVWKESTTGNTQKRESKLPQIICDPHLSRNRKDNDPNISPKGKGPQPIDPTADMSDTTYKAKNRVHFENFSVLRKQLNMSRRKSEDENPNASPKLLSDSTYALTSSIRPFTDERKIIHEEEGGGNTLAFVFPKRDANVDSITQKEALPKSRPKSDKHFKDINYNNKFPFPRKLKPVKPRHDHQTHF